MMGPCRQAAESKDEDYDQGSVPLHFVAPVVTT
jgi:hypothetical protein